MIATLFAEYPHVTIVPGFDEPIEIDVTAMQYCTNCGIVERPIFDSNSDQWVMPCHWHACNDCGWYYDITNDYMHYSYGNSAYVCDDCYVPRPEPDYDYDDDESDNGCECNSCNPNRGRNRYTVPMWERDEKTLSDSYHSKMSDVSRIIENEASLISPQQCMADFYVADYIMARVGMQYRSGLSPFNKGHRDAYDIRSDAKRIQESIIAKCDGIFRDYLLMAVGGELRHFKGISMPEGRSSSWQWFVAMSHEHGREYMANAAAELFEDDRGWVSGFGGAKWAIIARVLEARENGKLDARTFVDRVFSLQHNGGSALDKVCWQGMYSGVGLCKAIGDAHAADIPEFVRLFKHMTPDTARTLLFREDGTVRMSTAGMSHNERDSWNKGIVYAASAFGFDWISDDDCDYPKCSGTLHAFGDMWIHNGKPCELHPHGDAWINSNDPSVAPNIGDMSWFQS